MLNLNVLFVGMKLRAMENHGDCLTQGEIYEVVGRPGDWAVMCDCGNRTDPDYIHDVRSHQFEHMSGPW